LGQPVRLSFLLESHSRRKFDIRTQKLEAAHLRFDEFQLKQSPGNYQERDCSEGALKYRIKHKVVYHIGKIAVILFQALQDGRF